LGPGEETTAQTRLTLVPASLAKGLEYDYDAAVDPLGCHPRRTDDRAGERAVRGLRRVPGEPDRRPGLPHGVRRGHVPSLLTSADVRGLVGQGDGAGGAARSDRVGAIGMDAG
ncbi:hypothetical protein, partial [Streptomyces mirabilis]|uniref:hypothetical protein n=1 Tax=Streptomyces mirabilis TaxID=68239 RepID=UPI003F4D3151